MTRAEYSFAPPVGFAAVGDSTPPARARAATARAAEPPPLLPLPSTGVSAPSAPLSPSSAGVATPHSAGQVSAPTIPAASDWAAELPIGLRQDRERAASREALMRSGAPVRRGSVEEGRLSRLSPHPPQLTAAPAAAPQQPPHAGVDLEALCEELIARLRRELVVERERMGAPLGA